MAHVGEGRPVAYRPSQAAARLGMSRAKVWKLIGSGELPSVPAGRRGVRVPAAGLDAYLDRLTAPPAPAGDAHGRG